MKYILLVFALMITLSASAQTNSLFNNSKQAQFWVDSVYQRLSDNQRIAQLFWIAIENTNNSKVQAQNEDLISRVQPGGVLFFKSTQDEVRELIHLFQGVSSVPLMVAIDGEWGLGMRIKDGLSFPYQMTLGAIQNDSLLYKMGYEIGCQMKDMGINVNMAPVVDVNYNPNNPVIGKRSFGEDPLNVAQKSWAYAKGLQDAGIIAVAKHFPGHGDTNKDSHLTLPVISHSKERLDSIELVPFQYVIDKGIKGVMTAHLAVTSLEENKNLPSSLSKNIVTNLLKEQMEFHGLVITDAMNMKGVSDYAGVGQNELLALLAGNDIIEFSPDIEKSITVVKQALLTGKLPRKLLEEKCKKALLAKYECGLKSNEITEIDLAKAGYLKKQLYKEAITVIKNEADIPFKNLEELNLSVVCFENKEEWKANFRRYLDVKIIDGTKESFIREDQSTKLLLLPNIKTYKKYKTQYDKYLSSNNCILVFQGNQYKLADIENFDQANSIILTYENNTITRDWVNQLIFGAIPATGKLPVSISDKYKVGCGIDLQSLGRLSYTQPEALQLNSSYINTKVDSVVNAGLTMKAFPGCRVFVAIDGKVIFNKCYGYHTYDSIKAIQADDVYDLASVTKISGPLPLIMKGVDGGLIDLDQPFSAYWPDWQKKLFHPSNKEGLSFREVLTHQAALTPYINYYPFTLKDGEYRKRYYDDHFSEKYSLQIDDHLYLKTSFKKKIYKAIRKSPLLDEHKYKYSGLSFMIYPELLSNLFHQDYEQYLYSEFFKPLGASSLRYNPLTKVDITRIVPTEMDNNFRHKLSKGRVHDEAAAVMGGISGNAGLFASADDLAKLMQMYLQRGEYGGRRYLSEEVVEEFRKVQFRGNENRRGVGFDKPIFGNDTLTIEQSYPAPGVSPESFGHSGFTGTFVWMDPKYNMLYIFLSNRVHPTRDNRLLYQKNIRPSIQQVFYDAIKQAN
ncbi:glycoside hydrolase family 3 N-terminal domain-containing protein [Carboxylicivirga linearis]|uniref:beta-N-acetylhexosaminidase n=1 Tax=Carboxylicivirga linearis TaxID=1628157 RepID=A0ABS5JZ07_9BACT|nr:glycoside hydrolase family 3 N-terminal domain-containing protein [Carboxylicivirga linearis]MBS2100154.1 serine hydrolase [Carboxylicivirga linearis]